MNNPMVKIEDREALEIALAECLERSPLSLDVQIEGLASVAAYATALAVSRGTKPDEITRLWNRSFAEGQRNVRAALRESEMERMN